MAAQPAAAADDAAAPALGTASLSAVAYAELPRPSYVEVVLADDSPDNVRLAWEIHNLLQKGGWLAEKGVRAIGPPLMASYDPPWAIPFMRRNEVQIEVE